MIRTRKKVGLALGGGAARGIAHIGILKVLARENIPIDMVAGTSAGAAVGALYTQGRNTDELQEFLRTWDWKQRALSVDFALPRSGLIAGGKIKKLLRQFIGDVTFEELRFPFACVATDLMTGEQVVIDRGPVVEAVRASISVPIVFSVVRMHGRYLVDGGLVNPVPVSVLKNMGADFIIAANVTPAGYRLGQNGRPRSKTPARTPLKEPNIFGVIGRSFAIANSQIVQSSIECADVVIEPRMPGIGLTDFGRVDECIHEGELAAADAALKIKRQLGLS